MALGDLCLACENYFYPYFEQSMDILFQAGLTSLYIS